MRPRRCPVRVDDLDIATDLGDARELRVDRLDGSRERFAWRKSAPLLWIDQKRAAVIVVGGGRRRYGGPPPPARSPSASAWRRWTGEPARSTGKLEIDIPDSAEWGWLGRARLLAYRSDKWTPKPVAYEHDLEDNVGVWKLGGHGRALIVVAGGEFDLSRRGLVG